MGGIQNGATPYTIKIGDRNWRVVAVDRVVSIATTKIGIKAELAHLAQFAIAAGTRVLGRVHPVALLQAQDTHPGVGHTPGKGRTGGTGTNNEYIHGFMGHHSVLRSALRLALC